MLLQCISLMSTNSGVALDVSSASPVSVWTLQALFAAGFWLRDMLSLFHVFQNKHLQICCPLKIRFLLLCCPW